MFIYRTILAAFLVLILARFSYISEGGLQWLFAAGAIVVAVILAATLADGPEKEQAEGERRNFP